MKSQDALFIPETAIADAVMNIGSEFEKRP